MSSENKMIRKTTGQLSWASSQTRPDLSFDALQLSTILNRATFKDAKESRKTVAKAKKQMFSIKFSHLGNIDNLHIKVFPDASLGNMEENLECKSVMGSFIALSNDESEINPLNWKAKVIEKVAPDIKTAETLALENSIDDAIYLSKMISEIYTGKIDENKIPLVVYEDSKSLVQSIYSTKKVKRKSMRVVVSTIQQRIKNGDVKDIHHIKSEDQLGDAFTKKGVKSFKIVRAVTKGKIEDFEDP